VLWVLDFFSGEDEFSYVQQFHQQQHAIKIKEQYAIAMQRALRVIADFFFDSASAELKLSLSLSLSLLVFFFSILRIFHFCVGGEVILQFWSYVFLYCYNFFSSF